MRQYARLRHPRRARGVHVIDGVVDADGVGDGLGLRAITATLDLVDEMDRSFKLGLDALGQFCPLATVEKLELLFGRRHDLLLDLLDSCGL